MQKKTRTSPTLSIMNLLYLPLLLEGCSSRPADEKPAFQAERENINLPSLKNQLKKWFEDILLEEVTAKAFLLEDRKEVTIHFSHPVTLEKPLGLALYDEKNGLTIRSPLITQEGDKKIVIKFGIEIPKGSYTVKWDSSTFHNVKPGESSIVQSEYTESAEREITISSVKNLNEIELDIGDYEIANAGKLIFVIDEKDNTVAHTLRVEVQESGQILVRLSETLHAGNYRVVFAKGSLKDKNGKIIDEVLTSEMIRIDVLLASLESETPPYGELPDTPISSETMNEESMLLIGTGTYSYIL